jgi:Putative zinc-finger
MSEQTPSHPSDLVLASVLLGKASPEEAQRVEAHAGGCPRCRLELDEARRAGQRFSASVFPRTLPAIEARLAPRRAWRSLLPALGLAAGLATAAGLGVLALRPEPPEPAFQTKGAGALKVFGRRGERVFAVEEGAPMQPGDRIRFGIQAAEARFVLVASVDGRGQVNLYQPSTPLSPGGGPLQLLPDSIALDDAPGPERIFALLADGPLEDAQITAALRALAAAGPEAIRHTRRLPVPYAQASVLLEKRVP